MGAETVIAGTSAGLGGVVDLLNYFENKKINKKNYDLQKEQLAYQKDLQTLMFKREDTAHAREVRDLKKAGLSPVLSTGAGASAGPVVATEAPQLKPNIIPKTEIAQAALNMMQMSKTIEMTDAQKRLADAQASKNNIEQREKEWNLSLAKKGKVPTTGASAIGGFWRDSSNIVNDIMDQIHKKLYPFGQPSPKDKKKAEEWKNEPTVTTGVKG